MSSTAARSTSPSNSDNSTAGVVIIYDGECIFCASYVKLTRLRENLGKVELVNAREITHPAVQHITSKGLDLNEGMAVIYQERIYHGADAVSFLAAFTRPVGPFNALNKLLFTSKPFSRLMYPLLRFGRNTTLLLRGRKQIKQ